MNSESRSLAHPVTLASTTGHLAALVHSQAKGGKTHVVGVSLGAHVRLDFVSNYPDLVLSVFVSGYGCSKKPSGSFGNQICNLAPYASITTSFLESRVPIGVKKWAMDGADLDLHGTGTGNIKLTRDILEIITCQDEKWWVWT